MKKYLVLAASVAAFGMVACNNGPADESETPSTTPTQELRDTRGADVSDEYEKGATLIASNDCLSCHEINKKNIGPAYKEVAAKYELNDANLENLANKIIKGGSGAWGNIQMTPHPNLDVNDAKEMVRYILSLKNQ